MFPSVLSLPLSLSLIYIYICVCVNEYFAFRYICESLVCLVPIKDRQGAGPLELELQMPVSPQMGPLEEQPVCLTTEPSPQPLICSSDGRCFSGY